MEQLFAEIRESVQKEAEQLVTRAKRVAERTLQYAREEAEQVVRARREAAEREAAVERERAKARRVAELRRAELQQQEEFLERLYTMVLERLRALPRKEAYRTWLQRVLEAALQQLGAEEAVVRCNASDRGLVEEMIAGTRARVRPEPAEIAGGVIVETPDGRVSVDCSIEAELARVMEEVRDAILARIVSDRTTTNTRK